MHRGFIMKRWYCVETAGNRFIGSIFTNDIVSHYIARDRVTDRQKVVLGRGFIVLIVLVTYVLALKLKDRGVFQLAIWCFSGFASLFPVVFASIFW